MGGLHLWILLATGTVDCPAIRAAYAHEEVGHLTTRLEGAGCSAEALAMLLDLLAGPDLVAATRREVQIKACRVAVRMFNAGAPPTADQIEVALVALRPPKTNVDSFPPHSCFQRLAGLHGQARPRPDPEPTWVLYGLAGAGLVTGLVATAAFLSWEEKGAGYRALDGGQYRDEQIDNVTLMAIGYGAALGLGAWALSRTLDDGPALSPIISPQGVGLQGRW